MKRQSNDLRNAQRRAVLYIAILAKPGQNLRELGQHIDADHSAVHKLVRTMEAERLVVRQFTAEGGRAVRVFPVAQPDPAAGAKLAAYHRRSAPSRADIQVA